VQALGYATDTSRGRFASPLGASVHRFLGIVGGQVVVAGLAGSGTLRALTTWGSDAPGVVVALGLAGLLLVVRALVLSGSFALRMLALFAALVLAAALSSPAVKHVPRWQALQWSGVGARYWVIPTLAFLVTLAWCAARDPRLVVRWTSRAALAVLVLVGIPRDFRVPPRPDLRFAEHAARFAAAPSGTVVRIPIPPAGWRVILRKR